MRALGLVGVACLVLVLAAAPGLAEKAAEKADKPKDLIVGTWKPEKKDDMGVSLEFKKDGTLKVEVKKASITLDGKYKFTKDDEVEVEMTFMGEIKKETMTVKVTKDKLTTKDSKGKEESFERAK